MKEILQAVVVLLIGLPFVYMAVDVTVDLIRRFSRKAKPVVVQVTNSINNIIR